MSILIDCFRISMPSVRSSQEQDEATRWPPSTKFKRLLIGLGPLNHQTVAQRLYFMRSAFEKFIVNNFLDRNLEVLDSEEMLLPFHHTCTKRPEEPCVGCENKAVKRIFVKACLDEVPERLILGPAKAKLYKRKRWQTEYKALLIQKKWDKRVVNKTELVPARVEEYYSLSLYQADRLREWMNDE